jgi:hypothetical protein
MDSKESIPRAYVAWQPVRQIGLLQCKYHRVPTHNPLPLRQGMQVEITFLPSGIGKRYSQTISNLEHAALLRRCERPLYTKALN